MNSLIGQIESEAKRIQNRVLTLINLEAPLPEVIAQMRVEIEKRARILNSSLTDSAKHELYSSVCGNNTKNTRLVDLASYRIIEGRISTIVTEIFER